MMYLANRNAQANGDNEVHTTSCSFLPSSENRHYLGDFTTCHGAIAEARKFYPRPNGCYWCANACHTS